jgi:hypothetical protein
MVWNSANGAAQALLAKRDEPAATNTLIVPKTQAIAGRVTERGGRKVFSPKRANDIAWATGDVIADNNQIERPV